jgi:Predicted N-acetylglucosaminyl transferase
MRVWLSLFVTASLIAQTPTPTASALIGQAEALIQKDRFADAEPLLRKAAQLEPGNVEVLYRLGYVYFRQRRLPEATAQFKAVLKLAPPAYFSRYFLGRISMLENKPAEAITWFKPIVDAGQKIFDSAGQLAAAYLAAGEPRKAVAPLRAAIAETPWDSNLYYRLGRLYQQLGESELAREAFGTSTRLKNANREDVEHLVSVSRALAEGDSKSAAEIGARIADRPDANPDSLVALGVLFGNANAVDSAIVMFERAAARNQDLFQAQFNLGLALMKAGRAKEALGPLERAVKLLPQSTEANVAYGLAAVMNQEYASAIPTLERAWTMDANNVRVGSLLANAYLRTGEPAKAVPLLKSITQREQTDAAPLLLLVEALAAVDDQDAALEVAQQARSRFPELPQAQMAAAQQLARVGRYQEARPVFEQVLKLAPGLAEAELGLADCLQKAGEHSSAVDHYRAALGGPATALAARLGLARSLIAMRKLEESRKVLEEGLTTFPNDASLRLELSRVFARLGKPELAAEQAKIVEKLRAGSAK